MKAMICEMCNSNDLVKQDGMFVCQHCGTKYSVEEAKKLLGTVVVDKTAETEKTLLLARRARDENNSENAEKYYSAVLLNAPNNWEAAFYSVYFSAMSCTIAQIESSAYSVANCLKSVFPLIQENLDEKEQLSAIREILEKCIVLAIMMDGAAFKSYWQHDDYKVREEYAEEYCERCEASRAILGKCGDLIYSMFSGVPEMEQLAADAWKAELKLYAVYDREFIWMYKKNFETLDLMESFSSLDFIFLGGEDHYIELYSSLKKKERDEKFINDSLEIAEKIGKIEPDFYTAFAESARKAREEYLKSKAENDAKNKTKSSGGCYVATSVYGSYDCPQVWTLRRYRDNMLAKTWYGRTFIRTYYAISPTLVKWFGHSVWFKNMWKPKLDRMVKNLRNQGVEDTPYNDKRW